MNSQFSQEFYNSLIKTTMGMNVIILLPFYIMYSLGLYTMAKRQNIPNCFLAWIPIANLYILGLLIKDSEFIKTKFKNIEWFALGAGLLYAMLIVFSYVLQFNYFDRLFTELFGLYMFLSILLFAVSFGIKVFMVFMYYHLYKLYAPEEAALYTGLSVFSVSFALILSICKYDKVTEIKEEEMVQTDKQT